MHTILLRSHVAVAEVTSPSRASSGLGGNREIRSVLAHYHVAAHAGDRSPVHRETFLCSYVHWHVIRTSIALTEMRSMKLLKVSIIPLILCTVSTTVNTSRVYQSKLSPQEGHWPCLDSTRHIRQVYTRCPTRRPSCPPVCGPLPCRRAQF